MAEEHTVAKREWIIKNDDRYETEEDFRNAVVSELAAFENIGHRTGMCLVVSPARKRNQKTGEIETLAWIFESATVPLLTGEQQPEQMPEPDLEPDEVEEPEDQIAMVNPANGDVVTVPESDVSDLMEQGWEPTVDGEVVEQHPEPAVVGNDPYEQQ